MTLLLRIDPEKPEAEKVREALGILRKGGVIAFPTETFYGLGADARNASAVEKIFRIKGRNFQNPLPVIIAAESGLAGLVEEVPDAARTLIRRFWPGPLTLVFRASAALPPRLTAGTGKIGIRVSSHPLAGLLSGLLAGPLTSTSANLSGAPECRTADEVIRALGELPNAVIDGGPTPGGAGSTIIDITVWPPRLLRQGAIPDGLISNVLDAKPTEAPHSGS